MDKILVVDDEIWVRELIFEILKDNYDILLAEDGIKGLKLLQQNEFFVALIDVTMPGLSGLEILKIIQDEKISVNVIIITALTTVQNAVDAMKLGAFDFITKPFDNEKLRVVVKNAVGNIRLKSEVDFLRSVVEQKYSFGNILGKSKAIQSVVSMIKRVLDNDVSVMITGESGTGKEVVARTIHENSNRSSGPFIPLDCTSIPVTLIENELFGHEKGAYTGASNVGVGRFELADGGTLFLDEIGNLSLDIQAKLLRVLQEKSFSRIGGVEKLVSDVRIITATNSNLNEMIEEGTFREDLFYRINVIPIKLPPLRDRGDDVLLLSDYFLKKVNAQYGKRVSISKEILEFFLRYRWPGNIRELENLINRLVIIKNRGLVAFEELPAEMINFAGNDYMLDKKLTLKELEDLYIQVVFDSLGKNVTKAANSLGITRKTLQARLKNCC